MVLCRFFQQGNCRYGNNCRFEHQGNPRSFFSSNQYGSGNYSNNQPQSNYNVSTNNRFGSFGNSDNRGGPRQFSQANSGGAGGGATFTDFVNSVILELDSSIKGNQYPFSCFAPQKDGDNWPGLEDMSPEELRFEAYQCQQQGRMNTYIQGVDQLKIANAAKNNEIKSRSPAVMDLLRKCFQGQKIEDKQFSAPFGQQQQPICTNVGANVPFTFSLPQFGGGSQQQGTVLPFGQSNPIAPAEELPPSYRDATASTWPTSQPFAASNPLVQPANIFGSNTNANLPFGQPQQQSVFGTPQQQSVFGTPPQQQSIFGTPPPPLQQQQQSAFGTPSQPFGVTNTSTPFQAQTGIKVQQPILNTTTNDPNLKGIYTAMNELTDEEREQFMATSFVIGRIPIRPPPKELC